MALGILILSCCSEGYIELIINTDIKYWWQSRDNNKS